jgi:hypothetical protein
MEKYLVEKWVGLKVGRTVVKLVRLVADWLDTELVDNSVEQMVAK